MGQRMGQRMRWASDLRLAESGGWLIPIALLQGIASPSDHFAPPEARPIIYILSSDRQDGRITRHFEARRQVTFHATADGYDADLELLDSGQNAGDDIGAMFQAAAAALKGQRLRYHLDRRGRILSIDNGDAVWEAFCQGVSQMDRGRGAVGTPRGRSATAVAQSLRATPPAMRRAMLDSMLAPLIAPTETSVSGDHIVTLPVTAPDGQSTTLTGIEHRSVDSDNRIVADILAEGTILPTTAENMDPAQISYHRTIVANRHTGLIERRTEENAIMIGKGSTAVRTASTIIIRRE